MGELLIYIQLRVIFRKRNTCYQQISSSLQDFKLPDNTFVGLPGRNFITDQVDQTCPDLKNFTSEIYEAKLL